LLNVDCDLITKDQTDGFLLECVPISSFCLEFFTGVLDEVILVEDSDRLSGLSHFPRPVLVILVLDLNLIEHEVDELFFACTIAS
jgi:hypothetical protein